MAKDRKPLHDDLTGDDGGWLDRLLADEVELDRRSMWRLGSWGVGAVAALVVAILAARMPATMQREQLAAAEVARQTQQVQWVAQESQKQTRQLSAAVETLNSDRDRLYTRLTVLEQGLDSVTGALARRAEPAAPPSSSAASAASVDAMAGHAAVPITESKPEPASPPKVAPVATIVPASPGAKPDEKTTETAKIEPGNAEASKTEKSKPAAAKPAPSEMPQSPAATGALSAVDPAVQDGPDSAAVARTEFGVDLGGATSVEGLRALWRGALKSSGQHLGKLQPIIMIRERNDGTGLQLRLVAGPLSDAAAAARICATLLTESNRACETSVYDGQRLALHSEKAPDHPVKRPKRRSKPQAEQAEPKPKTSSFSSFFGAR
jgi:hypothetical protein